MIIDAHTHCFPDKIAQRALNVLKRNSGNLPYLTNGTVSGLLQNMDCENVDYSFVLNIATNAHQMHQVNDFAASLLGTRLIPFGSVYPDSPDVLEELERIKSLGIPGVKFHPEYQDFFVDDEKMKPIYKKISSLNLITVFHAGYDIGYGFPVHASPQMLKKALSWFDSPVIAAHWGGWCCWEGVLDKLCDSPAYFDISFGQGTIPAPVAKMIFEKRGADHILFGSDSPWHLPHMEQELLSTIPLTEEEYNLVMSGNAVGLLNYSGFSFPV